MLKNFVGTLVIFSIAALSGCSEQYNGERLFWKAQKVSAPIFKDPAKATPEQYAKGIDAYNKLITQLPGTEWSGRAQLSIGSLYEFQKKHERAREKYRLVLQDYHRFSQLCMSARMAIAKSYEAQDQWDDAVKAYKDLAEYHPWTLLGLQSPLYIAAVYEKRKESSEALRAYEGAVSHYKKLILNAPSKEIEFQVKQYLAAAYQQLHRWQEAVSVLEELTNSKVKGIDKPFALLNLGKIYQKNLDNPEKAAAAFSRLINEFPKHPFVKVAQYQMDQLKKPETPPAQGGANTTSTPQGAAPGVR
ncbi:MAG: tetratricopeptide repeat protein [Candidatus Omnitrophica bacterium]|nr:tetratricopeptide repeat protein [Candidatus Omnitrophota bacterium]